MNKWAYVLMFAVTFGGLYSLYEAGYASGRAKEKTLILSADNEKLHKIYDSIAAVDEKLNHQAVVQEELRAMMAAKQTETVKEVIKYAQNPNATRNTLDSEWVRIYNSSLPDVNRAGDSSPSQSDVKGGESNTATNKPPANKR